MKITTEELRRAVDRLLAEFETNGVAEWDIEADFYWDVPSDVRYAPYEEPKDFSVGQMTDDIERVKGIAAGTDAPVPPGLVWVASVLRLAGEQGVVAMKGGGLCQLRVMRGREEIESEQQPEPGSSFRLGEDWRRSRAREGAAERPAANRARRSPRGAR